MELVLNVKGGAALTIFSSARPALAYVS